MWNALNEPLARWSEVGHKNYGFNDHVPINLFDSLSIVVSWNDGEKSESQMAKGLNPICQSMMSNIPVNCSLFQQIKIITIDFPRFPRPAAKLITLHCQVQCP